MSGYSHRRQNTLNQHQPKLRRPSDTKSKLALTAAEQVPRKQKNFLKSASLYQNAFLYVFSRLFMCTALVYIPLWLDERTWSARQLLEVNKNIENVADESVEHIASVPLVSFLA